MVLVIMYMSLPLQCLNRVSLIKLSSTLYSFFFFSLVFFAFFSISAACSIYFGARSELASVHKATRSHQSAE